MARTIPEPSRFQITLWFVGIRNAPCIDGQHRACNYPHQYEAEVGRSFDLEKVVLH